MQVEQLYTGCLAEAAYYIESEGEAVVIDPLRDPQPYMERAERDGAKIKYVLETHFHADFVSGHLDLAKKTGATIVYGPGAETSFDAHIAKDGEILRVGALQIKVLHTPGHTLESTCYLLFDEQGQPHSIFTGDTLFIGDVGRPDLAVKGELSERDLAAHLYDSLRERVMPLPDHITVYPAHGAGSACGKNMSSETFDTLGHQKEVNYALREDMTKEEFIKEVTEGLAPPPQYFPKNAVLNKTGYSTFDEVMKQGLVALDADEFERLANEKRALILDTRSTEDFPQGFIPGSLYVGIDGNFAPWVGTLIQDLQQPILVVADPGRESEVVMRLSRVGYDNTLGFLQGGFAAWEQAGKPTEKIPEVTPEELEQRFDQLQQQVVDVRKPGEYSQKHVKGVKSLPLDFIHEQAEQLPQGETYYLHCLGGYRSLIAASILKQKGYDVVNIQGGFKKLVHTNLPMEEAVAVND